MGLQVIVGAGPVGSATARLLRDAGHTVRVVTRSGSGIDGVEKVAADATDPIRLTELARGAVALYNCANPPYHRWPALWPPLADALRRAAAGTGAVLVTASNLYGYGPVTGPMTESLPLAATTVKGRVRAAMWTADLAAHERGEIRTAEARGSDYLGAGAQSMFTVLVAKRVLAGKTATVPADLDAPHSFTVVADMAATLVALGADERAWGRAWHVPTNPAISIRALAGELADIAGQPAPKLRRMSPLVLRIGGLFNTEARELPEMAYQFAAPFLLDSSAAQATFGLVPTPLRVALREMVAGAAQSTVNGPPSKSTME